VLVAVEAEELLAGDFDRFSAETGIPVEVTAGDSAALADRLIDKSGGPADVIITSNAAEIWRAADRGALRPIRSAALETQPPFLRDPDGYWGALSVRWHTIYHNEEAGPPALHVRDLGEPDFAGRLCLSSSRLAMNRSLLAYLIEADGALEAERLVRRWVRNLAYPPFGSELELLEALRDGRCMYGIASWDEAEILTGVLPIVSEPPTLEITAVGVNRHAAHPDAAQKLADWLLRHREPRIPSADRPAPLAVHIAGWRDEEAGLLAERAGYR
jgi:iron(III) transport system substrate-binding protein